MAEKTRKRPLRRAAKTQPDRPVAVALASPARRIAIAAAIILGVAAAVIAVVKYTGTSRSLSTVPGSIMGTLAPSEKPVEAGREIQAAVLTTAVIVPAKPTSRIPLAVAYEASNPGGAPVEAVFRWYVDGSLVQEGPLNALQPGPYRKGATVSAEVAINDRAMATPAVTIGNGQPDVSMVSLGPDNAAAGTTLSAIPAGKDPDGDPISYTYQWRVNGAPVGAPGAEGTFSTAGLKKRDSISAQVTYTDGESSGSVASNTVTLQNQSPKILSDPPLEVTSGLYSYQLTAKDPDGDPLTYRLDRFPAGMSVDAVSGLIRWALPRGVMFTGRHEFSVAVTVSDGDGGSATQDFTIVIFDLMVN